jgi:calcium-independent phospholipase A2-gamma
MKMSIDEAERIILDVGNEVFAVTGNNASTFQSVSRFYFYGERHSSRDLERKLHEIYGDLSLLDLTVLHDSSCKVAAVSTLASEIPAKPFLFRNFREHDSRYLGDWKFPATTAAMATTAAPTFFRPVVTNSDEIFQDGAMLANNPAHVALHEAVKIFPTRDVSALVSIGTGRAPWERGNLNKASLVHSLTRDLNTLIYSATSTEAVADILGDMLDKNKFFRFQPELARVVELDETKPAVLEEITRSTERYLEGNTKKIEAARKLLLNEGKFKGFSKL